MAGTLCAQVAQLWVLSCHKRVQIKKCSRVVDKQVGVCLSGILRCIPRKFVIEQEGESVRVSEWGSEWVSAGERDSTG